MAKIKQSHKIIVPESKQPESGLLEIDVGNKLTIARLYHSDSTTHYATSCPHCGQGIFFVEEELYENCIMCPHCKVRSKRLPPLIEPFENPFIDPIAQLLIPDLDHKVPTLDKPMKKIKETQLQEPQEPKLTSRKKETMPITNIVPEGD